MAAFVVAAVSACWPSLSIADAPQRVVSMNVCTDQLVMLVAAPGQLYSVSYLATQPGASAMVEEAKNYPVNHGLAEEIFLMKPDLVVAGTYTTRATVSMLRRLGYEVEEFAPETSFEDVRINIRRMGVLLGQQERANGLIADLDNGLEKLKQDSPRRMVAATYSSNSYSAGSGSLSAAVIEAAGLENLGSRLGILGSGSLALEQLVLSDIDVLVATPRDYAAPALAQQNFVHPAYRAKAATSEVAAVRESDWICGGPFNLTAAGILRDASLKAMKGRDAAP